MMKPKEKNRFFTSHLRLKKVYRKSSMQGTQTRMSGGALKEWDFEHLGKAQVTWRARNMIMTKQIGLLGW